MYYFIGLLAFAVVLAITLIAHRYALKQWREAERLASLGWFCIGVNLITGPIMIPPLERLKKPSSIPTVGTAREH